MTSVSAHAAVEAGFESAGARPTRRRRWIQWLSGAALLGTVILVARHFAEARAFVELAEHSQLRWLALAALLQVGTYLADAGSWRAVLARAGHTRPLRDFFTLGLAKLFLDQAVPSGGIGGTSLVVHGLERRGVPRPVSMAAVVVDLYAYYAAYFSALLCGYLALDPAAGLGPIFAAGSAGLAVAGLSVTLLLTALTTGWSTRIPGWLLRWSPVAALVAAVSAADRRLARRVDLLARAFGYQLLIFALDAATLGVALRAVGVQLAPGAVFASFMLASLARTLGVLPGGLGTFEAACVATLHRVGVPVAAALAATLLFRGFSFWLPLLPGLVLTRREAR